MGIFPLWLITLPLLRLLFPLAGYWLDRFEIETTDTVGYHVVAVKKSLNHKLLTIE